MTEHTGYMHRKYAESLSEHGEVRFLQKSGSLILERQIPESPYRDAIGCYPLFACSDWDHLESDLNELDGLVSLSLVADPFGNYELEDLRRCFRDVIRPFKTHYVVDLTRGRHHISPHHRRNIRKAARFLDVTKCDSPKRLEPLLQSLYDGLLARHKICGIAAFSHQALQRQLGVPGLVVFQAQHSSIPVGMHIWYVGGRVAYYHMGACDNLGYASGASFALMDFALDYFAERTVTWLNLGGAPGLDDDASSGLARFKRGWATNTRTVYFCGRILNPGAWADLLPVRGDANNLYFPQYRAASPVYLRALGS